MNFIDCIARYFFQLKGSSFIRQVSTLPFLIYQTQKNTKAILNCQVYCFL